MTPPQTGVMILGSDTAGTWLEAICQNQAMATYYLAQLAARQDLALHRHTRSGCYSIGPTHYAVIALQVLDLAQVDALRKEHEPCPPPPLQVPTRIIAGHRDRVDHNHLPRRKKTTPPSGGVVFSSSGVDHNLSHSTTRAVSCLRQALEGEPTDAKTRAD